MSYADELEVNPFYNHALVDRSLSTLPALMSSRKSRQSYLQQTLASGSILCVPDIGSLPLTYNTDRFLDLHILRTSPLFKGEYSTIWCNASGEHYVVKCTESGRQLTASYAGSKNVVDVLYKEAAYIQGVKYGVWLVDRPLDRLKKGQLVKQPVQPTTAAAVKLTIDNTSLEDMQLYLQQVNFKQLDQVEKDIQLFKCKYLMLPSFLSDAASKLEAIAEKYDENRQTRVALLNYIHHHTHTCIYPCVKELCKAGDSHFEQQCTRMKMLKFSASKIEEVNPNYLPILTDLTSPLQIMSSLTHGLDEMCSVAAGLGAPDDLLSSDELIPLLIDVLVQKNVTPFPSLIHYIEVFGRTLLDFHDTFDFALATYKAAVQYISEYQPSPGHNLSREDNSPANVTISPEAESAPPAAAASDSMTSFEDYVNEFSEEKPYCYMSEGDDEPDRYKMLGILRNTAGDH